MSGISKNPGRGGGVEVRGATRGGAKSESRAERVLVVVVMIMLVVVMRAAMKVMVVVLMFVVDRSRDVCGGVDVGWWQRCWGRGCLW